MILSVFSGSFCRLKLPPTDIVGQILELLAQLKLSEIDAADGK